MRPTWIAAALVAVTMWLPSASPAFSDSDLRTPRRSDAMRSGFGKAQASFRQYAAHALKLAPERVLVSPIEEDPSVQLDERVGQAWAFYGSSKDRPSMQVRGWAIADGTVVSPRQNLGVLFEEAGIWTATPLLAAETLADRMAWAMGMNHRVVGPSTLQIGANGAGTLTFQVAYRPPGPGGAGGGPNRIQQCKVTLTANHKARWSTTALK